MWARSKMSKSDKRIRMHKESGVTVTVNPYDFYILISV